MTKSILLNTVSNVKEFVTAVSNIPYDVSLKSGKYVVNAKSVMGIFSLDLSKPIDLLIEDDVTDEELESISKFIK